MKSEDLTNKQLRRKAINYQNKNNRRKVSMAEAIAAVIREMDNEDNK